MFLFKECVLLFIIYIRYTASSEHKTLLERLSSEVEWKHDKDCETNKILCFDVSKESKESILLRSGFASGEKPHLTKTLKVAFHAKKEGVDVCGKTTILNEVKEFELPKDGSPLHRPAEDYRNPPQVSWEAEPGVTYSLIIWDVFLMKIRGWWANVVERDDKSLKGDIIIRYSPPANPRPLESPIMILLLQQKGHKTFHEEEWYNACVPMSPSVKAAHNCRERFKAILSDSTLIGAQLYHTNGKSLYEKYRACTESLPCDDECITHFQNYAHDIAFMTVDPKKINHYVNVHFYTLRSYDESELPSAEQGAGGFPPGLEPGEIKPGDAEHHPGMKAGGHKPDLPSGHADLKRYVDVRARPGDNMQVRNSDTRAAGNAQKIKMNLEIGVPYGHFFESKMKYSVLIADQDAPGMKDKPWGHYFVTDLELPELLEIKTENVIYKFQDFTPPDGIHRYHILLLAQQNDFNSSELGSPDKGWDIKLLSQKAPLVGFSWMLVNINDNITCPPEGIEGCMRPQPYTTEQVGVSSSASGLPAASDYDVPAPPTDPPPPETKATTASAAPHISVPDRTTDGPRHTEPNTTPPPFNDVRTTHGEPATEAKVSEENLMVKSTTEPETTGLNTKAPLSGGSRLASSALNGIICFALISISCLLL